MTIAESIQLNKEQIARAFGVPAHMLADPDRTAAPRYWSLCMISENHGTVGKAGDPFSHAPGKHERVLVVEAPAAAGAPVDQVNLQLVASAGRQADVDRALRAAQAWVNEEYMCGRRMGKGEPALSGRADAAKTEFIAAILALAAPAAAQAGQVAVPLPDRQPMIGKLLDQFSELPVLWGLNEPGALVRHGDVFKMLVAAGKAAQASTSGERQEGGK